MARVVRTVEELNGDAETFYGALNEGTDLACILLASSYLDQCVGTLLHSFLIDASTTDQLLDVRHGILGTFGNRVAVAYALGLVSKGILQNLRCILEIRNVVAHSHLAVDFRTPEIVKQCEKLTFPPVAYAVRVSEGGTQEKVEHPFADFRAPRARFQIVCSLLSARLLLDALSTQKRPKKEGW